MPLHSVMYFQSHGSADTIFTTPGEKAAPKHIREELIEINIFIFEIAKIKVH